MWIGSSRRQDPVSGAGPEVLSGPNEGPKRFPVPPFHFLQERTYISHQTRYSLSSWLKQTILLCYKQADQQALDLVQVKAHDIRAFLYGGVSVDQIMQACHWKVGVQRIKIFRTESIRKSIIANQIDSRINLT